MIDFYDLEVWKLAREYQKQCAEHISRFPEKEKFSLTDQLRRSSRSVADNIAEGHGKFYYKSNIQHLRHARGSLLESMNQLMTAHDEGYIRREELEVMFKKYKSLQVKLNRYISSLRKINNPKSNQSRSC